MKDPAFIDLILIRLAEARSKVENELLNASVEQLNWKPDLEKWSIAECLEHLLISDSAYLNDLERIASGTYQKSFLEKFSPLTSLWGKTLKDQMAEQVKKKMTAPEKLTPSASNKPADYVQTYISNLAAFQDHIAGCKDADLDRTVITSPTIRVVTYSLRDAFHFLAEHEHRHLNQAIRLKGEAGFPE